MFLAFNRFLLYSNGVGRSGVFCLVYSVIREIRQSGILPQLVPLIDVLRQSRKHMIYEQKELLFAYDSILYYCQDLLMQSNNS